MVFVRVGITAISTEECDVTFQVCVSVMTRPVSLPIYGNTFVYTLSMHYTVHCMFVECSCVC